MLDFQCFRNPSFHGDFSMPNEVDANNFFARKFLKIISKMNYVFEEDNDHPKYYWIGVFGWRKVEKSRFFLLSFGKMRHAKSRKIDRITAKVMNMNVTMDRMDGM